MTDLVKLDPRALTFARHGVHLRLTTEDRSYPKVTVVRAFPLSDPDRWLSVRAGTVEVGVLEDPAQLSPEDRRLVEEALAGRYLVSRIRRILAVEERFGTLEWDVETDRGRHAFTTRRLRENVSSPSPDRHVLTDVDGNRYDVPDVGGLDDESRARLLRHL